jgi:hypothetical protein
MPRDAYRFARGEQLTSNTGQPVRISQPYDFMAVADHTDGMGMILDVLAGAPNIMADAYGRELNAAFNEGGQAAVKATMIEPYTTTPPLGSPNPRGLWKWMANWEEKTGGRMLAIPHNGDLSNGWMPMAKHMSKSTISFGEM